MSQSSRFSSQRRVPLAGSERKPFAPAEPGGTLESVGASADQEITVSVLLKRKDALPAANSGVRLTRTQFRERHGARAEAERAVRAFAEEFGLRVERGPGPRTLQLTGPAETLAEAFGVAFTYGQRGLRTRTGAVMLPEELAGEIVAVLGLDNRPQAKAHFRRVSAASAAVSYSPVQVAQLYGFPEGASAAGQTIGLIELGGGYKEKDLSTYFGGLGLPVPKVTAVPVDGGKNAPTTPDSADGEVLLDIEVSAAVAPGAALAVYFAPNTDQGFIDAVTQAVHDTENKPSVVSISWGGPESSWTQQSLTALDEACQAAAALGVTITVAAGDNGSTDGATGNNVDFPASSPHVLACGGTKLEGSGTTITSEVVWNETAANEGATGGGVSDYFPLPSWQANVGVPGATTVGGGRGVPDVSGDADPATGYNVLVDGQESVIGGTSAVAPLWAGLIALANAANGKDAGFVNPTLYASPSALRDITSGNNGAFSAGPGWDACTGLGSPNGAAVIAALAAGASQAGGTTSGDA